MSGYGSRLTVVRQERNDDGDPTGTAEHLIYEGFDIAPEGSTERADGTRETTTQRLAAYGGPHSPDILPGDRVYLDNDPRCDAQGTTLPPPWYVVGTPEDWGGDDWDPGQVVNLQRYQQPHQR